MSILETRGAVHDLDSGGDKPFSPSVALIGRDPFLVKKEFFDGRFPA
jgi:hypothetical protein